MVISLRMEVARITASLKKIGAPAHLDKVARMEADLATRQRKIEELRARMERLISLSQLVE